MLREGGGGFGCVIGGGGCGGGGGEPFAATKDATAAEGATGHDGVGDGPLRSVAVVGSWWW